MGYKPSFICLYTVLFPLYQITSKKTLDIWHSFYWHIRKLNPGNISYQKQRAVAVCPSHTYTCSLSCPLTFNISPVGKERKHLGEKRNRGKARKPNARYSYFLIPHLQHSVCQCFPKMTVMQCVCMFKEKDRWKIFEYSSMNLLLRVKSSYFIFPCTTF